MEGPTVSRPVPGPVGGVEARDTRPAYVAERTQAIVRGPLSDDFPRDGTVRAGSWSGLKSSPQGASGHSIRRRRSLPLEVDLPPNALE
jgi:hypothetical protein